MSLPSELDRKFLEVTAGDRLAEILESRLGGLDAGARRVVELVALGEPIGATNCLNFGNPEKPDIMWQFGRAVEGISAACRALDLPITGGNVMIERVVKATVSGWRPWAAGCWGWTRCLRSMPPFRKRSSSSPTWRSLLTARG